MLCSLLYALALYPSPAKVSPHLGETYRMCPSMLQIWIYAAHFEIRQRSLSAARKLLGTAIGMCPKNKLFR